MLVLVASSFAFCVQIVLTHQYVECNVVANHLQRNALVNHNLAMPNHAK